MMIEDDKDDTSYVTVMPGDPLMEFAVMAKPCAWISSTVPVVDSSFVSDSSSPLPLSPLSPSTTSNHNAPSPASCISLIQGYNIADMSPPTLMMASDSLPIELVQQMSSSIRTPTPATMNDDNGMDTSASATAIPTTSTNDSSSNMKVTLSCTSTRESHALQTMSNTSSVRNSDSKSNSNTTSSTTEKSAFLSMHTFDALGLIPNYHQEGYPPAVSSAPIQMYCHVSELIALNHPTTNHTTTATTTDNANNQDNNNEPKKFMILLIIDVVILHQDILTKPPSSTSSMNNNNERTFLALVDAVKMKPIASMGAGRFGTMKQIHLLLRPTKKKQDETTNDEYQSDPFLPASSTTTNIMKHDNHDKNDLPEKIVWDTRTPCPLGFNPLKAIVLPRPIGWISTYYPDETVPHVAPYSFYTSVASDMVAFSAYRPNNEPLKDAQLDVEETQCFGVNTVTPDVTIAMNMSSVPIHRMESEFHLFPKNSNHGGNHDDGTSMPVTRTTTTAMTATCIHAPLVRGCKVMLECSYVKTVNLPSFSVLIGKIISMKVAKAVITTTITAPATRSGENDETKDEGRTMFVDATKLMPVTRGGYLDEYAIIDQYI